MNSCRQVEMIGVHVATRESDPQYMEIEARKGNTLVLRDNEAYATWK